MKFANNGIGSEGASTIFQSLTHNKSVTYLDLSKNKINDKADVALSKVFKVFLTKIFSSLFIYDFSLG